MANLSFYTQANMANFYVWNGYVSSYSYSHISLSNYPYSATYYGSFTYSSTGLSGGTVTGYEQSYYGELSYEVDSASVSATTLYRYLNSGNGAAVQSYVLSGNDVIKGSIYGDHIKGYAGIDSIYGYQGNDVLDGGSGADYLYGGVGDDTFYVDNVGDSVIESVGEGTDHVFSSVSFSLSNNLENLTLLGSAAINGFGNSLANTIIGNAGANRLDGGQGADTLIGGAGNDLLYGGAGTDVLYGGAGDDWLEHVDDSDDPEYDPGQDTLYGGVGNDTYVIDEEGATIVELAGEGTDLVLTQLSSFVLGENIENLYHDDEDNVDFTGTGNNLNNWIRSTGGNDTLLGLAGDDKIEGGAGNDLIDGGTGADIMLGGAGNDTYVVDNIGDKVYETTTTASTVDAGGSDTVEASISYTLGNFVENLTLTDSGNINGTGNALANTITGNAGNNVIDGKAGADKLDGGKGSDIYLIGLASDHVSGEVIADSGDESGDIDEIRFTAAVASTLTLNSSTRGIEKVVIGTGTGVTAVSTGTAALNVNAAAVSNALDITGNAGANILTGTNYADTLNGGAGNDRLDGGQGADTLIGGTGNDTYVVDNEDDVIQETSSLAREIDTVEASLSWALGDNLERLILTGSNNIDATGNRLNNTLAGNSGNNRLDGGTGADIMLGGAGNDTYVVDNIGDKVYETTTTASTVDAGGSDTVEASISYTLGNFVENLTLTDSGNINGTGNALANTITGNAGNNVIDGKAGADKLDGGEGSDIYLIGLASDHVSGEVIADSGDGSSDIDEIRFTAAVASTLTLNSSTSGIEKVVIGTGAGVTAVSTGTTALNVNAAAVSYALDITGNAGANILTGTNYADTLNGGAGNDRLDGGQGADTLIGGTGNDTYVVDNEDDVIQETSSLAREIDTVEASLSWALGDNLERLILTGSNNIDATGNRLNNTLAGNSGNNRLDGGTGADIMLGGAGNDTYVVDNIGDKVYETTTTASTVDAGGSDTVEASISYTLGNFVENLTLTDSGNINGTGNALANTITGNAGNNVIDGKAGADKLDGGEGSDIYLIGLASDHVSGEVIADSGDGSSDIDEIRFTAAVASTLTLNSSTSGIEKVVIGTGAGVTAVSTGTTALNVNAAAVSYALDITGNAGANILTGTNYADTLNGGAGNDLLYGGAGTDVLYGGAGDDWLEHVNDSDDPGYDPGQDTLYGGVGNDTYVIDEEGATIVELAGEGTDLVLTQLSSFVLGENIENLYHDDEDNVDFTGTGNNLNNWIRSTGGNDTLLGLAGDDKIEGGAGNDLIDGGTGADIMLGGAGNDTYVVDNIGDKVYETTTTASTVDAGGSDTVEASISYTLGNFVENLTLTDSGNINGTGNALANTITGNAGNNVLNGGVGNDTLHGGDGNDLLQGGLGLDLLVGDAGADIFRFDSLLNATTNVDTIKDFLRLEDVIQLENSIFTKLTLTGQLSEENFRAGEGVSAQDTNDHILYDTSSGALYYDADGSGVAAAVQFATLTGQPALTHTDFYVI